jgi:hypothetical protein
VLDPERLDRERDLRGAKPLRQRNVEHKGTPRAVLRGLSKIGHVHVDRAHAALLLALK